MSKQELMKLVAPLSMEERRELREILDAPSHQPELEDPITKVMQEIEHLPPMPVPPDFSENFRRYRNGGEPVES